jgi:hypothetical protein
MNKFVAKFKKDLSIVPCLSTNMVPRNAWYMDYGASCHGTSVWCLFFSLTKQDSSIQVEFGDDAKYPLA